MRAPEFFFLGSIPAGGFYHSDQMRWLLVPLCALVSLRGCGRQEKAMARLETQLKRLHSANEEEREGALDTIKQLSVNREIGVRLLRAASESYPSKRSRPSK